jgi:hypothetical protein
MIDKIPVFYYIIMGVETPWPIESQDQREIDGPEMGLVLKDPEVFGVPSERQKGLAKEVQQHALRPPRPFSFCPMMLEQAVGRSTRLL